MSLQTLPDGRAVSGPRRRAPGHNVAPSCMGTALQSITVYTPLEQHEPQGSGTRPIMAARRRPRRGEAQPGNHASVEVVRTDTGRISVAPGPGAAARGARAPPNGAHTPWYRSMQVKFRTD